LSNDAKNRKEYPLNTKTQKMTPLDWVAMYFFMTALSLVLKLARQGILAPNLIKFHKITTATSLNDSLNYKTQSDIGKTKFDIRLQRSFLKVYYKID